MKIKLHSLLFFVLISLSFAIPSRAIVDSLDKKYQVYNPLWSIKENGGSLPLNTLAPYEISNNELKRDKIPLILIHGVVSDSRPYCNWSFLLEELKNERQNELNNDEFKVYIYRYPSSDGNWKELTSNLKLGITELLSDYPAGTKINLVVSSLGGVLLCDAVSEEKLITKKIHKIVSLGTPFLGTPLLNENLATLSKNYKPLNWLLYQSTNFIFPSLSEHISWSIPLTEEKNFHNLSKCQQLKSKFINYAAFTSSPLTEKNDPTEKEVNEWLSDKLKHSDYRHSWNAVMHYKLGWEINQSLKNPMYLLNYNDGLVPIYSSLWLNPELNKFTGQQKITNKTLAEIKLMNPQARLFGGLDHTDYTDMDSVKSRGDHLDLLSGSRLNLAKSIIADLK